VLQPLRSFARSEGFIVAVLAAAAALVVSPILAGAPTGDDAFNAYVDGWAAAHHATLPQAFAAYFLEWDIGRGRFIPLLQLLNVVQFRTFHQALPLKILQVSAIAANVATLYAVCRAFGLSSARATLAAAIALLTLQTRFAYDPISQYNLHLPLSTEAALLAVLFFARFSQHRRRRDLTCGLALFAIATLTYEIFLPLAFALPLILRSSRRALLPVGAIVAAEFVAVALIRHLSAQPPGSAYAPNVWTGAYPAAVARQLFGTLPFSYALLDPQAVFRRAEAFWWLRPTRAGTLAALVIAGGFAVVAIARRGEAALERFAGAVVRVDVAAAGLALLVGPAALVAASPFYQQTITLGTPYIPVFAQGFGLALACASIEWPALAVRASRLRPLAAGALACAAYVLADANALAVRGFDSWKYPRETIVRGFAGNVGASLRNGDSLFLDKSYIVNERFERHSTWSNVYFYRELARVDLVTQPIDFEDAAPFARGFELRSRHNEAATGAVIVARLDRSTSGALRIGDALVFERGGAARPPRPALVFGGVASADFTIVRSDASGTTFRFRPSCNNLSPDVLANDAPTSGRLRFGNGFSVEESDDARRWRWGGARASLEVRNPTDRPLMTRLDAQIGTIGDRGGRLRVDVGGRVTSRRLEARERPLSLPLAVPARTAVRILFAADAPNVALAGDARDLRFRLIDEHLHDTSGCALADRR